MEKPGKGRVRFLNDADFNNLLSSCPDWLKPIVLVAKLTGLRQGNLLSLEWTQIDLIQRTIIIEQTKNGDRLGLPICDPLHNLLSELKLKSNQVNLVFHDTLDGTKINPVKIYRAFKQACKKAGIENFRFHDLRHCFASQLVQNNVDLFRVQRLLGHKDSRMTQRYAHLTSENLQSAVKVFDNVGYNGCSP